MVFTKSKGFLLVSLMVLLASCSKPKQQLARERFIVTTNNLNIRIDPTQLSKTIGTLSKGDTIIALASDKFWVMVKVENQTGFISSEYLNKIGPVSSPHLIKSIESFANWKSWPFWIISIILITLWITAEFGLMRYEYRLKSKFNISAKKIAVTPLVFFASGILIAVLYLFWKDQVIDSLFHNFSILPKGMGSIAWIIWIQFMAIVLCMIIDFIGSLYKSGIKHGHVTFLIEQGINIIIFSTAFFLTLSLYVAAIIFLVVFFAILYTIIVTENSKLFSGFIIRK